ncbi:hypothetical protein ACFL6D_04575 [Spirochaetota bacterium]
MKKIEKYSDLKKALSTLEKDKKYFFMKRYYLFKWIFIALALFAVGTGLYYSINLLNRYKIIESGFGKNRIFITSYSGQLEVFNENNIQISLDTTGLILSNDYKILTGAGAECTLQMMRGYFISIGNNSVITIFEKIVEGSDRPFRKIIMEKGTVSTITYYTNQKFSYWLETPTSYLPVKSAFLNVEIDKSGYHTKIKVNQGDTIITPKTLYSRININEDNISSSEWISVIRQIQDIKFSIRKNDAVIIPKIIDLSENEFVVLKHLLKLKHYEDKVGKLFFSGVK